MKKLAIVTTHPIQYNAPFFKLLNERGKVYPKVFYTWPQAIDGFDDPDFEKQIIWDIPLLDGYNWEAVRNISKKPSSKSWRGIDCPKLIERITAFNPDAVLIYGWRLKSHFKTMRYFKGKIPVWFTGDSTLLNELPGWRKVIRRISLKWVYRYIDRAFYVGTNNKTYFLAHGLKEDQLVFFPHAVDNCRFSDSADKCYEQRAIEWKKKLSFDQDDMVLLFAGKLEPKKNPSILLKAVQEINKEANQQIKLLFVGNGSLEDKLRQLSSGDTNIEFLPFQNQSLMPVVYRLGDLYCLPSQGPGETWGLAVSEAMASSRPVVVSSRVGCAVDLVKNGESGFVFSTGDQFELQETIIKLINIDRDRLGQSCLGLISQWSFKKKCEAIEQAI